MHRHTSHCVHSLFTCRNNKWRTEGPEPNTSQNSFSLLSRALVESRIILFFRFRLYIWPHLNLESKCNKNNNKLMENNIPFIFAHQRIARRHSVFVSIRSECANAMGSHFESINYIQIRWTHGVCIKGSYSVDSETDDGTANKSAAINLKAINLERHFRVTPSFRDGILRQFMATECARLPNWVANGATAIHKFKWIAFWSNPNLMWFNRHIPFAVYFANSVWMSQQHVQSAFSAVSLAESLLNLFHYSPISKTIDHS